MPTQPDTAPNNTEIDQALKEFEAKSKEGQNTQSTQDRSGIQAVITPQTKKKEVEGVSFDTGTEVDHYTAIKLYEETGTPKIIKAVLKYSGGAIKNQKQAEWILFGFVIVAVGISIYLFFGAGASNRPGPTSAMVSKMTQGSQNSK